jgi:sirohydrochlorin cobaltochelatase
MKTPIIITAFGTTSEAIESYRHLDNRLRQRLDEELIWCFSSRLITRELTRSPKTDWLVLQHPGEVLERLAHEGCRGAVLQSLHLFPGSEFHKLALLASKAPLPCSIGMPIFTSEENYRKLGELLEETIAAKPEKAILIVGHGTEHPSWTAYYSLEKILRRRYGKRVFVGVVEKSPDSSSLVEEIVAGGYQKVLIIPLFLIAGMHVKRDICGKNRDSYQSRLERRGIEVETLNTGIAMLSGIEEIIVDHIKAAQLRLDSLSSAA